MPLRTLVLLLSVVISAAAATIALATLVPGALAVIAPLALLGALALRRPWRRRASVPPRAG